MGELTTTSGGQVTLTRENLELLRQTLAPDLTDPELELFGALCRRLELDPFTRQVYASKIKGRMVTMVAIDGLRLVAQRTGEYAGQHGPQWCGEDGVWRDVWLDRSPPAAARVAVLRRGFDAPLWAVARWSSYAQQQKPTWRTMPDVMLAKCAEAQALRRAFPAELSGVYSPEEMDQAGATPPPAVPVDPEVPAADAASYQASSGGQDTGVAQAELQAEVDQHPAIRSQRSIPEGGCPGLLLTKLARLRSALQALQPGPRWANLTLQQVVERVVLPKAAQAGIAPADITDAFVDELTDRATDAGDRAASAAGD